MNEPLTALVTRTDRGGWTATVKLLPADVHATSLVELTYLTHAAALEAFGSPQAIDFRMPYDKDVEAITAAAAEVAAAEEALDAKRYAMANRLRADNVSTADMAVLLRIPTHRVRALLAGGA